MLVLTSWLKEFVDFEVSVDRLAEDLTLCGLEVEAIYPAYPWLSTVITARIEEAVPHPEKEGLKICRINCGDREIQVVCGAPNADKGLLTALALPGTELPELGEVAETSIHGIQSQGMLCSEAELLVGDDASAIMSIDPVEGASPGAPVSSVLNLDDDWVLEIGVTPNRADCLSILGVAREVSAVYNLPIRQPGVLHGVCPDGGDAVPIRIEAPEFCGRYSGAVLEGVRVAQSPAWIRHRLIASGIRPISNIVDVTNIVLMERGQPLHAFDLDTLQGPEIRVRTASEGESIVTLDGKSRELSPGMLVIADRNRPVAVAGVMGGAETEVSDRTGRLLLESACFAPSQVRRTAKMLKLPTEASYRFERGVDPEGTVTALNRAVELMGSLSPGLKCTGLADEYPVPREPKTIKVRPGRVNSLLGIQVPAEQILDILGRVGLDPEISEDGAEIRGKCPSYRMDLFEEIDLVEEVARLHGFHRIPTESPRAAIDASALDPFEKVSRCLKNLLFAQGLTEVISYSFVSRKNLKALGFPDNDKRMCPVRLQNPLSDDQTVMRTSLMPSLLLTVSRNQARRNMDLRLFEMGSVFFSRGGGSLPEEEYRLAAVCCGARHPEGWAWPREAMDYFDLKGVLEQVLSGVGIRNWRLELGAPDDPYYTPGTGVRILCRDELLGTMGQVHPDVADLYGISGIVFSFDLSYTALLQASSDKKAFKPLPRYPSVERDIAIILSGDIPVSALLDKINSQNIEILEQVGIFDVYSGKPIPEGYRSIGLRFRYRAMDHTLSDSEVASVHAPLVKMITEDFNARLRDS